MALFMYFCPSVFQVSRACLCHRQIDPHRCQASVRMAEQKTITSNPGEYLGPQQSNPRPFLLSPGAILNSGPGLPGMRMPELEGLVFRNEDMSSRKQVQFSAWSCLHPCQAAAMAQKSLSSQLHATQGRFGHCQAPKVAPARQPGKAHEQVWWHGCPTDRHMHGCRGVSRSHQDRTRRACANSLHYDGNGPRRR